MTYKCRVCNQPITREMAIRTKAGHFTNGYCSKHFSETPDVSSTILEKGGTDNGQNSNDAQTPTS